MASVAGCLVGGLFYFAVLLDLRWAPARTAHPLGYASNFFDLQAEQLLNGRLSVPEGSLGIEGFVIGDQTYMYFPPFPALIRIPVQLITTEFNGRLTVLSMAIAWIVLAVVASRLVWLVGSLVVGDRQFTRSEAVAAGILIAMITGGTVLTFNASLPWVYHEVYAWAVPAVVGSMYWLLRVLVNPSTRAFGWLTAFALAAALTRVTGGLAVCAAIGLAAVWEGIRNRRNQGAVGSGRVATHHLLGLAAVIPMAAAVTVNMAKFNHPYMFPLEHQVWTKVNAHRQEALRINGGSITGSQFLEQTLTSYFRPHGLRFTEYFPWITLPADPPPLVNGAFFDQTYRTASVTATTPLLLVLTVSAVALLAWHRPLLHKLIPPLIGATAVGGPVLLYGYIAYRYTSEFAPGLIVGGIIGFWFVAPRLLRRSRWKSRVTLTVLASATAYSLIVQSVLGLSMSAFTSATGQLQKYLHVQRQLSGGPLSAQSELIEFVDELPPSRPADTLAILGQCSALYLASGDRYEPWILVEAEPTVLEVSLRREVKAGYVKIATVGANTPRDVLVQVRDDHHVRVVVRDDFAEVTGPWFGVYPNTTFRVGIALRPGDGLAQVTSTPGGHVTFVPALVRDEDWITMPGSVRIAPGNGSTWVGLHYRQVPSIARPLCRALSTLR